MAAQVNIDFKSSLPVDYKRKKWFLNVKKILKIFIKKPEYVFIGQKPTPCSIILSNHEGASAPLALELYSGLPIRFWGTYEMNSDIKTVYQYLTVTYYHGKKQWNLLLARLFCLLAAPLTSMFYRGLDLISTYDDVRLKNTMTKSLSALDQGHTLVIFPEDSSKGYFKELVYFHPGAVALMDLCRKKGLDIPVYVAYYKKETKQFVFDAPVTVSQLLGQGLSRVELAEKLRCRCNELGKMAV